VLFATISLLALREFITLTPRGEGITVPSSGPSSIITPLQYWLLLDRW
jgi:predicted CDP-diglyceride synthetase/phosphatidate cytidylyltransferase